MVRSRLNVLAVLFTLTGGTALLAEQAFEKLLSTLVGASTPAAAMVLAIYFGGLTLGGILFGTCRRHTRAHPLRLYAALELGVGLWALLLYLAFDKLIPLFVPLLALGVDRFWLLQVLRLIVAACWILPATVPMGATFPAVVNALEQLRVPEPGKAMARFYSFNLVGAIVGAVLGPFLVLPYWGVDGALLLAFGVNLTVALTATGISSKLVPDDLAFTPATGRQAGDATVAAARTPWLIYGLAFFSGLLFFALEVVWTHLIGAVLGTSVYAFAAMLAVVLLGLGLGGAQTATRLPDLPHIPTVELGELLLCSALVLAIVNMLWPHVSHSLAALGSGVKTFAAAEALRWLMAVVMVLPAAMLLGTVYPTLFRLEIFPAQDVGTVAGRLVAANAIGCIAGALSCGFCLIPWIGSERTLLVLTVGCAAWGLGIHVAYPVREARPTRWVTGTVVAVVLAVQPHWNRLHLTSGEHVYFGVSEVSGESELKFFHEDTRGGITTVVDNPAGARGDRLRFYRTLLTNGKFQANDAWEMEAQTGFALTPMMYVPRFDDALVIGLGSGRSAHIVEAMWFATVDVAEIAPGIVKAAREYFRHINDMVLDKPRVRLFLEDGRNLLLLRNKQYDLITMEISSVWFAGATNLYSEEFYRLARRRLKPSGIFQQWIQLHHIGTEEVLTAIATLRRVFPYVSVWVVGGQGILVASLTPQEIQPAFLVALQQHGPQFGWEANELQTKLAALLSSRLLAPEDVSTLVKQRPVILNTDRNRRLEYFTPRYNYSPLDHRELNIEALAAVATFPAPPLARGCSGSLANACRLIGREQYLRRLGLEEQSKSL